MERSVAALAFEMVHLGSAASHCAANCRMVIMWALATESIVIFVGWRGGDFFRDSKADNRAGNARLKGKAYFLHG